MNRYRGTMSQFLAWRRSLSGWLLSGIACLTLAGCSAGFSPHTAEGTAAPGQAQHQVADFVAVDCADIWAHSSDASDKIPSTGCGALTVPIASRRRRRGRRRNAIPTTAGRTRSVAASCLLMLKLPLRERRDLVARLDTFSPQIAVQVRPLYQLWRDGQTRQLQLVEERARYAKLQQSSDSELETLRQQELALREQLELTTRKLENLTDIERQLSSRKPGGNFGSEKVPEVIHDDP